MIPREYAPVSGELKFSRRSILKRDRFRCQYCGHKFESHELTYDHVIPRSCNGKTVWTNIVTACIECNKNKSNRPANYSGRKAAGQFRPLKESRRPTNTELLRAGLKFLPNDLRKNLPIGSTEMVS